MKPEVDIALLIPHFNELSGLQESLKTVKFSGRMAIIIVDDGSSADQRPDSAWAKKFAGIVGFPVYLIFNERNEGIDIALNKGLAYITTEFISKYIARLDCRDLNTSDRLDVQYRFLEANADIWLLGSWADVVLGTQRLYTVRTPAVHRDIKRRMLSNNCFIHPTVIFRTAAVQKVGLYPTAYPAAEDYAYFFSFVEQFETANIPRSLVFLPKSDRAISSRRRREQLVSRMRIILKNFSLTTHSIWGLSRALLFLIIPTPLVEYFKELHDRTSHY